MLVAAMLSKFPGIPVFLLWEEIHKEKSYTQFGYLDIFISSIDAIK